MREDWTVKELAAEAGVSGAYIREVIAKSNLFGRKRGGAWLIKDAEALRWLAYRRAGGAMAHKK